MDNRKHTITDVLMRGTPDPRSIATVLELLMHVAADHLMRIELSREK